MLQSNNNDNCSVLKFVSIPGQDDKQAAVINDDVPSPVSLKFFELFEELTGWRAEFQESRDSMLRRQMTGMENEPPQGTISIVDMSASWPANKPTCHRQKCDELIAELDVILTELNSTRAELKRARSALAGFAPTEVAQSEEVVDSFVPRDVNSRDRWDDDKLDPAEVEIELEVDTDFDVCQDIGESTLVKPPFEGWSLGGATGIAGSIYVDWRVNSKEQISITVGRIESDLGVGDSESIVQVDPLSNEYFLSDEKGLNSVFCMGRLEIDADPRCPFYLDATERR